MFLSLEFICKKFFVCSFFFFFFSLQANFPSKILIQYYRIENVIENARQLKRVHGFPVGETSTTIASRNLSQVIFFFSPVISFQFDVILLFFVTL